MNHYPSNVKEKLNSIILSMAEHHWLFSKNPGHDFTQCSSAQTKHSLFFRIFDKYRLCEIFKVQTVFYEVVLTLKSLSLIYFLGITPSRTVFYSINIFICATSYIICFFLYQLFYITRCYIYSFPSHFFRFIKIRRV